MKPPSMYECPHCRFRNNGKISFRNHCQNCRNYFYFWDIRRVWYMRSGEYLIDSVKIRATMFSGNDSFMISKRRKNKAQA